MASAREHPALLALAATATSGALAYFGFGPHPIPALTWLAALPVLLIAPRVRWPWATGAAAIAWVIGQSSLWSYCAKTLEIPLPMLLALLACYPLLAAASTALFRAFLVRGKPLAAALAVPVVWVAGEYLISIAQPHGAWLSLGYTQADVRPVIQVAALTGVWGVTFLVTGAAAAIAALEAPADRPTARRQDLADRADEPAPPEPGIRSGQGRGRILVAAPALAVVIAVGAYSSVRLLAEKRGPEVQVAVLGGPVDGESRPDSAEGRALLQTYLRQIGEQADRGARAVVLPEKVFTADEQTWPLVAEPLADIATTRHVDVVVGAIARHDGVATNVAVAFPGDGGAPVTYTKKHLIPGLEGRLTAGAGTPARIGTFGLIICKDLDFPTSVREQRAAGATVLLAPAWDMGDDGWLHGRMAVLRGVELGVSVARAGRNGEPAISDPTGRVLAEADAVRDPGATIDAAVPTQTAPTPYARIGDAFARLCIATVALLLLTTRKRRPTNPATPPQDQELVREVSRS